MNIVQLLNQSVSRYPEREAIVLGERRVKYHQLGQAVAAVTHELEKSGVQPGDRVALLMGNFPGYVSAYYGVLAAGAIAVPLNPASRHEELTRSLRHSGSRLLIADAGHAELQAIAGALPGLAIERIDPTEVGWAGLEAGLGKPDASVSEQVATILYTSGTTGTPKGVTLTHGNVTENVNAITDYLGLTSEDSIVSVLPFHYSYGNSILQTHIAAGATLILENGMRYPARVLGRMEEEEVTGFSGVPSTYAVLLSRCRPESFRLDNLRYVTQAGGAMTPALARKVSAAFPTARLFVMYGQTEATARLTYLPPEELENKTGSVGLPVKGVNIDIRNDIGSSLPTGQVGEVWVSGNNVMRGYWREPKRTAEVIRGGWLRTGDIGYRDTDGYLYLQGRRDDIIKSGAHRISPYEIEEVISQLEQVEEVAVAGVDDEVLGQCVKAVIVPRPNVAIDRQLVCRHCLVKLPPYKVPKYVEFVPVLPKTASGKVKRYMLGELKDGRDKDVRCAIQ